MKRSPRVLESRTSRRRRQVPLAGRVRPRADEFRIKNEQLQTLIRTKAIESIADGVFVINAQDPDFPVIYANQAFQKITGYAESEIIGRAYFLLYGVDADPRVVSEIKQTLCNGKSFHGEMLNFRKDGKRYFNLLRITLVYDSYGVVTHYVGIETDVTLLREREMELDERREELLHVTRVGKLAEFVSSLAHEISQPLTAILSYAQAAHRMLAGREPEIQNILTHIVNDDRRATEVIQRLRSLLKKSAPEMRALDINALLNETIVLISTDATVRNDVLKADLQAGLPPVWGDRVQLQQVVLNLVSNSFDALEGSQGIREILIRTARQDAGTIIVEVKDSGCGIPARDIPRLFTRFFTSKIDGLGMGLSISRSIIEAHGGRLDVGAGPDRGASFYFTLPVYTKDG